MTAYVHELTPIEIECGVTLEAVARELPRGVFFREDGRFFMVSKHLSPALAGSVARAAFGGPAEFSHLSRNYPVYKRAEEQS